MLRLKILIIFWGWNLFSPDFVLGNALALRRSVFKITTTSNELDFKQPWKFHKQSTGTGTGFYIGNKRIITNAHVVANATFISVQRDGDHRSMPAVIEFIAHDSDLALLNVLDDKYFSGVAPLQFSGIPKLQSPVSAVGYPTGGDQLSVTEGVVSRIGYRTYVHTDSHDHLMIQVSSAINPGNSGGPVFQGRNVVGVAFQTFLRAQNVGYIIPTPIVNRFLNDIADGKYQGHPVLGLTTNRGRMSLPASTRYYGLSGGERGVVVSKVSPRSGASGVIQPGDVLTKISGLDIGVDGRVVFENERVDFESIYDLKLTGDQVQFELLRDRKLREVKVPVLKQSPPLVLGHTYEKHPRYVVIGGYVFTPLSIDYLELFGKDWYQNAPLPLRYLYLNAELDPLFSQKKEIIIMSDRLSHPVNQTIDWRGNHSVLRSLNGQSISELEDLKKFYDENQQEYLQFEFYFQQDALILPFKETKKADSEIAKKYSLGSLFWFSSIYPRG